MARYEYDRNLVEQALGSLNSAVSAINNTNTDIQKGVNQIMNARGAGDLGINASAFTSIQPEILSYIEEIESSIKSKAAEIEEYSAASGVQKFFSTAGMSVLKLIEGIGTAGENLIDGGASLLAWGSGLFGNKDFQDSVAEWIKKDHVGDFFYNQYENGALKDINKYSVMSHTGTAANVLKGIGVATGYVLASSIPGVGLGASTALATVGGIGSGTQQGLQLGQTFNEAFKNGVKDGLVAGGTTLVIGGAVKALSNASKAAGILNGSDDAANALSKAANSADDAANAVTQAANSADDVAGAVTKAVNSADDVANATTKALSSADDVANATTKALSSADDVANATTKALSSADDVANAATKAANSADDVVNAAAKASKIPLHQKIGNSIINKMQAHPTMTKLAAGGAGLVNVNQKINAAGVSNQYRLINGINPVTAQESIPTAQTDSNYEILASRSLSDPTSNIPETVPTPTMETPSGTAPSGNNPSGYNPSGNYGGSGGGNGGGGSTPTPTPITTPPPTQTPNVNNITTGYNPGTSTGFSSGASTGAGSTAEAILDEIGNNATSIEEIRTHIPTSTNPILTKLGMKKASSIPVIAGLGAAAVAGIGGKVYLDKKRDAEENDEEEIEKLDHEETKPITIEEEAETDEEPDYITPDQEIAFQE